MDHFHLIITQEKLEINLDSTSNFSFERMLQNLPNYSKNHHLLLFLPLLPTFEEPQNLTHSTDQVCSYYFKDYLSDIVFIFSHTPLLQSF